MALPIGALLRFTEKEGTMSFVSPALRRPQDGSRATSSPRAQSAIGARPSFILLSTSTLRPSSRRPKPADYTKGPAFLSTLGAAGSWASLIEGGGAIFSPSAGETSDDRRPGP